MTKKHYIKVEVTRSTFDQIAELKKSSGLSMSSIACEYIENAIELENQGITPLKVKLNGESVN